MSKIEDIEQIIEELIRVNEKIVTTYDSELFCKDYDETIKKLNQLINQKNQIIEKLEKSINNLFDLKQNFIAKRLKLNSFRLVPTLISFEYKFNLPQKVDTSSQQYFCYINMMDKLARNYDVITLKHNAYYLLDITSTLNLKELLKHDKKKLIE